LDSIPRHIERKEYLHRSTADRKTKIEKQTSSS